MLSWVETLYAGQSVAIKYLDVLAVSLIVVHHSHQSNTASGATEQRHSIHTVPTEHDTAA